MPSRDASTRPRSLHSFGLAQHDKSTTIYLFTTVFTCSQRYLPVHNGIYLFTTVLPIHNCIPGQTLLRFHYFFLCLRFNLEADFGVGEGCRDLSFFTEERDTSGLSTMTVAFRRRLLIRSETA